jgi:lycopene cyclase domain-containing protein
MSYLRFHFIFNLPLLVVLGAISGPEPWTGDEVKAVLWVLLAVMVFTAPWDNLAARWGIWGFPREKYTLRIGYLPVEEYAFFLLQSLNVILAIRGLLFYFPAWITGDETEPSDATVILLVASIFPLLVAGVQLRRWRVHAGPAVNYLLHLGWFLPVIYLQWVLAAPLFLSHAGLLALVTGGFGIYYTLADLVAVRGGTWHFDPKQITGAKLMGILPWEEVGFFFLTSLLVAQSYLLLLPANLR